MSNLYLELMVIKGRIDRHEFVYYEQVIEIYKRNILDYILYELVQNPIVVLEVTLSNINILAPGPLLETDIGCEIFRQARIQVRNELQNNGFNIRTMIEKNPYTWEINV